MNRDEETTYIENLLVMLHRLRLHFGASIAEDDVFNISFETRCFLVGAMVVLQAIPAHLNTDITLIQAELRLLRSRGARDCT